MSWPPKIELSLFEKQQIHNEVGRLYGPHADVSALYTATCEMVKVANFPHNKKFSAKVCIALIEEAQRRFDIDEPVYNISLGILQSAAALYAAEQLTETIPDYRLLRGTNLGIYKDMLLSWQRRAVDPSATLAAFTDAFVASFLPLIRNLPAFAFALPEGAPEGPECPCIPLIDVLCDVGSIVEELIEPYRSTHARELGLFKWVLGKLDDNQQRIDEKSRLRKPVRASEHGGSPREIVKAYLGGTFLELIFDAPVPFDIAIEDRGEHTAIVAGSGWGKTQLLQSIIAGDLQTENPPAIVVIDSTGAMVQRIQRLAIFNEHLRDRLLIIDPELDPVPALNPFDMSNPRFSTYDESLRERMQGEVIDLFNYVFSTIKNPLTTRMETAFAFMVRLLLSIPGANIHTLLDLLNDEPAKGDYAQAVFKPHIDKLDSTTQLFFKAQYYTGRDGGLREQIRARVFDILRVPAFERMFSTVNKVDFFTELNRGAIILVNTSENLLKDGSTTFGRYIIARVMAAVFERAPIPPDDRRQAFLIVDEAAPYFDESFEKLLNRVRQFKLGVVIAFQNLEQANEKLRSTIASSTAIKYAGGTGANDARWLSREMRCDPEFIMNQKRDARPPKWTQFACHVRNFTDRAVSLTVPFFTLENMPRMSDAEHAVLLEANRVRVAAPPELERSIASARPAPPEPSHPPTPMEALAKAYADLAAAMTRADWPAVAELKNGVIPALEKEIAAASEPNPSAPPPEAPSPHKEEPHGDIQAGKAWR